MGTGKPLCKDGGSLALCVVLSLLLHIALTWALDLLPRQSPAQPARKAPPTTRHLQVVRARPKPAQVQPKPQENMEKSFAKTSADDQQQRPEEADFIGSRDSVASGGPDAPQRRSDTPLPSMTGRESEEEIVTFDQERQDGDLAHEGKTADALPPAPPTPALTPSVPSTTAHPLAQGSPEGATDHAEPQGEGNQPAQPPSTATAARTPARNPAGEGLKLDELQTENSLTLSPLPPPAPLGLPEGTDTIPSPPVPVQHPRLSVYDPTLAPHIRQPGLRTHERRTRSTGRFVFGRRPALNVEATVLGRYEAEIYRRIARVWYAACDEHRGDIIPGSITVSLRLTKRGSIDSMDLVRRRGASVIQQSFSFGAIRRAALPPMPAEVQQGLIGELHEMILTFHFD